MWPPPEPKLRFDSQHCSIIGEVAQAHDGSLGTAHAYIDAIAKAGANAVKFQTHIAAAESTPSEPWRVRFSFQDKSRYDYWKRMEFTEEQWLGLKKHAEEKGLEFISSPFSIDAAQMLRRIGIQTWKVASGELTNGPLFDFLLETHLPIMVSTGMSRIEEVDEVVERTRSKNVPVALLQCTSMYPCPPEKVGLNMIPFYRGKYGCPVGLSDHSGTIFAGLAAATIGIEVLEVHVTLSRECFGPDVIASVTTQELRTLVEGVRFIETMKVHSVDKDQMAVEMKPVRDLFTKSIVAITDLPSGATLTRDCLSLRKPGTGIPADRLPFLIGRRLGRSVTAGEILTEAMFEDSAVRARAD
jgi:N,N'-diacetyllegionaminate synthase